MKTALKAGIMGWFDGPPALAPNHRKYLRRALLVDYLAYNATAGDLIAGTGGVRKLRWRLEGRGTRGGTRVIYFYYSAGLPLIALTAYAKNERENLSHEDKHDFRRLTKSLFESYERRGRCARSPTAFGAVSNKSWRTPRGRRTQIRIFPRAISEAVRRTGSGKPRRCGGDRRRGATG